MDIQLLTRQQLEILNRRHLGYPLAMAEKDYFLALALQVVYSSPLRNCLVFKGGTALHHGYLPQYRFSEDLDFTSVDHDLHLILTELGVELNEALDLMGRKEVREPISSAVMKANWQVAKQQQNADLRTIFCKREVTNQAIEELLNSLTFSPIG